jgi:thioredoxin reductase/NAD-dependent dihydropyrimidine dehydrogenase PreA subunit
MSNLWLLIYAVPVLAIFAWYLRARRRKEDASIRAAEEAIEASMTEPPSLHPIIDPMKCIGCRSCVNACPEQNSHAVLGIIRGKARLIAPANCIGHGACKTACPVDAIEQGRQAMDSILKLDGLGARDRYDVVIVGAGPAGFAASLAAMKEGLRFLTIEQDSLGGTVAHFPRGKLVMTRPADLPIVGKMRFTETSKEQLLQFWQGVEAKTQLKINYNERVADIAKSAGRAGFEVTTTKSKVSCRAVLLTIGRRGTPRQLGVPGEDQEKVVYRLIDPSEYEGRHVLVVGGGDSALEAAHSIAAERGTTVTLSYRSDAFSRAKAANRDRVKQLEAANRLRVLMSSNVREIREDAVIIEYKNKPYVLPNQAVIICAGGILPTGFLKSIGVEVETKFGTA